MLSGYFIWLNVYFISVIVYRLLLHYFKQSSNSLSLMLSCNNGHRNVNVMDLTDRTSSGEHQFLGQAAIAFVCTIKYALVSGTKFVFLCVCLVVDAICN